MKTSLVLLSCALVSCVLVALALPALAHAFGDEIVVGFMVPLTKKGASYGVQSRAATEVAVEEINTAGGIGGRKLRMNTAWWAYRPPPTPATNAPAAKAVSFARVTSMPMASAAVSSSLTASKARPIRDRPRRTRNSTRSARKPYTYHRLV